MVLRPLLYIKCPKIGIPNNFWKLQLPNSLHYFIPHHFYLIVDFKSKTLGQHLPIDTVNSTVRQWRCWWPTMPLFDSAIDQWRCCLTALLNGKAVVWCLWRSTALLANSIVKWQSCWPSTAPSKRLPLSILYFI